MVRPLPITRACRYVTTVSISSGVSVTGVGKRSPGGVPSFNPLQART